MNRAGSRSLRDATLIMAGAVLFFMKRLYRSRRERILGGVCGGIGTYVDTDPNIIRILWIILTLVSIGIGVVVYIVAWILIPGEPEPSGTTIIDAEIVEE